MTKLSEFFSRARTGIDQLSAEIDRLRTALDKLKDERTLLREAPLNKADAIARLHKWLDGEAAGYPASLKRQMAMLSGNIEGVQPHAAVPIIWSPTGTSEKPSWSALAWLLGPLLKERAAEAIEAMAWPDAGPPLIERRKRLDTLDKQIPSIERELEDLLTQAKESGIDVSGLLKRSDPTDRKAEQRTRGDKALAVG